MREMKDELEAQYRGAAETAALLWAMIDEEATDEQLTEYRDEYGDDDPNDVLAEWPLEVVLEPGAPFTVVLGTGGPHTEIECTLSGGEIRQCAWVGYWGGDEVRRHLSAGSDLRRVAELFLEMAQA